ncbi:hypothetical protein Q8F55_001910 [Vanrija albida]|uniref:Zn(2)-C6 fungal-type domain-containing protein n=1 Tax=Vanrija albida TaxID=181172 RepID=A0ABR3Q8K3_9TREE
MPLQPDAPAPPPQHGEPPAGPALGPNPSSSSEYPDHAHGFSAGSSRAPSPGVNVKRARSPEYDQLDVKPNLQQRRASASASGAGTSTNGASTPHANGSAAATPTQGPKRAAQACLRCRKQKLRCLGGWPCKRCVKSKNKCDFGGPAGAPGASAAARGPGGTDSAQRIENLEASVATLLAGMSGAASAPFPPTPFEERASFGGGGERAPPQWSSGFDGAPAPAPRFPRADVPLASPTTASGQHVHFGNSPYGIPPNTSPGAYASSNSAFGPSPTAHAKSEAGASDTKKKDRRVPRHGPKGEDRLAAVDGGFEAPFKPLVYQPSVWDNREVSRRTSPHPSTSGMSRAGSSADEPGALYDLPPALRRGHDDPITTDIVDERMAELLFTFFVQNCHPFMPIIEVADADAFHVIRHQSPTLLSAILAIAARFYVRYEERFPSPNLPSIAPGLPARLASLAQWHLAQTLLRKQQALFDVQAVLLLAAWGLESGGRGPDAWIVTGHASRIARRLGINRELTKAAAAARITRPHTPEWNELNAYAPKWRSWLGWFTFDGFLSLGFGRPQSTQFDTVDEQGFLNLRLAQPPPVPGTLAATSLYGDAYLSSQVELTRIGRDLINWGDALREPRSDQEDDLRARDLSLKSMLSELNGRLDDWCKRWIWSSSHYLPYLGPSARICRLQAEHMRLCLNSFALNAAPEEDKHVADSLYRGLQAAMSTIQTHHESSQTDLALSFATDYLTITLAQAAVFLIRIAKAPASVQMAAKVDRPVVTHYLKMSIDVLEASDLSETRLSTYLARTLRDISRAASIPGITPLDGDEAEGGGVETRPPSAQGVAPPSQDASANGLARAGGVPLGGAAPGVMTPYGLENYLIDSNVDLGYLLGLPGDPTGIMGPGGMMPAFGGEFGGPAFAPGGVAMGM